MKVSLDVKMVPNLKTALVWGTLPGATDETIYVIAHRDGWFNAAGDNASGVASMIGLAEYYAKAPQAERRRTMVFVGLDGHHNYSSSTGWAVGGKWMADNRDKLFAKTALIVNAEHPSTLQTYAAVRGAARHRLVERVHRAAMVCGRRLAPRVAGDCRQGVQRVRRAPSARAERAAAARGSRPLLRVPAGRRDERVFITTSTPTRRRRRRSPGPASRPRRARTRESSTR